MSSVSVIGSMSDFVHGWRADHAANRTVRVRSRDVSPSWAGCAGELVDVAVLLVRVAVARFDALVDVSAVDSRKSGAR
jgi:hypothetical protein